jgi:hypothetical protein
LLKLDTSRASVIEPTLTAVEMHAGADIDVLNPLLPDAAATGMPSDSRLSMAAFRPLLLLDRLQLAWSKNWPPPRLMLTEAILLALPGPASAAIRLSARTWSDTYAEAQGGEPPQVLTSSNRVKTCSAMRDAPGATPFTPPGALNPAAIPATWVPWPQSDATLHGTPLPTAVDAGAPPGQVEVPMPAPPAFT